MGLGPTKGDEDAAGRFRAINICTASSTEWSMHLHGVHINANALRTDYGKGNRMRSLRLWDTLRAWRPSTSNCQLPS